MTDAELIAMARAARVDDRSDGALYGRLADRIEALVRERDEARALLREARAHLGDHVQSGPARLVVARIAALESALAAPDLRGLDPVSRDALVERIARRQFDRWETGNRSLSPEQKEREYSAFVEWASVAVDAVDPAAIRRAAFESAETAIRHAPTLDPDGYIIQKRAALDAIRALAEKEPDA